MTYVKESGSTRNDANNIPVLPSSNRLSKYNIDIMLRSSHRLGHVLAIIPARGGSKGIPQKNIRLFAGKPLIAHTIAQARSLKRRGFIDRIIVSTDDVRTAQISRRYGAEVPFLRPKEFAGDKSPVADAVKHLLLRLEKDEGYQPDYILLLQTTSPLRTVDDIVAHFKALDPRTTDAVITVCSTHHLLFYLGPHNELRLANVRRERRSDNARQLFQAGFKLNGCFAYLIKREVFLGEGTFFPKRTRAVICAAWRSVDLDHPEDFTVAEVIYKNQKQILATIRKIEREKHL